MPVGNACNNHQTCLPVFPQKDVWGSGTFLDDELRPQLKHTKRGVVGMASGGKGLNASQFYITLVGELDSLDEKHTVFGQVCRATTCLGWRKRLDRGVE